MLHHVTYDWDASFDDLLRRFREAEAVDNEDVVGAMRALIEECRDLHEAGRVADLDRIDLLALGPTGELALGKVPLVAPTVRPVADGSQASGAVHHPEASVGCDVSEPAASESYLTGYTSWERAAGHHDALTDIFHLGMLMASLATRLDFRDASQLARFVRHRSTLGRLNPRLSPVLARVIQDMTKLGREERAADLSGLIDLIDDYRSVEVDDADAKASDLADVPDPELRREWTQEYFRNRLFEVTRRNKLLYFADRHGIDLTRGSLPVMLDDATLPARQLLTTEPEFLQRLARLNERGDVKGELDLRRWLQCADYPFLAPSLDKARSAARKDSRELGFNQLRLVLAFLRWHDDERAERINTPLVMLPVSLKKQHGTADGFSLVIEAPVAEAEINPVLRYVLHDRFKVQLPETLDLSNITALRELARDLESKVSRLRTGLAVRLAETPRVPLLRAANRLQLDEHRRRQRRATAARKDWRGIGYSYASDSYQPLGLELFDRFVRPRPALAKTPGGPTDSDIESGMPTEADLACRSGGSAATDPSEQNNPLVWEVDLCAVTLANFNTRKMSLVRDYEHLLDRYAGKHRNYKRLFDATDRPSLPPLDKPPHIDRNTVLPSDPSQDDAVLRAATGESYVIQGPPGTGKSQTIANLLADLAASGKSVLFVCEKRVALDVVHRRLRDAGIGDLASLVHDAREDRLGFIANLKSLYASWLASRPSRTVRDKRDAVAADVADLAERLRVFSASMQRFVGAGETTARDLMGLALAGALPRPRISLREREAVPPWGTFVDGERQLADFEALLDGLAVEPERAIHALSALPKDLLDRPDPAGHLRALQPVARGALADFEAASPSGVPLSDAPEIGLQSLAAQAAFASQLSRGGAVDRVGLLDPHAPEAQELQHQLDQLDGLDAQLFEALAANSHWSEKPTLDDAHAMRRLARRYDGRIWGFLSPEWRAQRERLSSMCGGVPPDGYVALLDRVIREHRLAIQRDELAAQIKARFAIDDLDAFRSGLVSLRARVGSLTAAERVLMRALRGDAASMRTRMDALAASHDALVRARVAITALFPQFGDGTAADLADRMAVLDALTSRIVPLATALRDLDHASPGLGYAARRAPLPLETFRAASLHMELQRFFAAHPAAQTVTARDLKRIAETLDSKLAELRQLNARRILDERKSRFRGHVGAPSATYDAGRAFLEHQFSLFRPSAALRDFLTGAPGDVVRDLKPIWMMSPLSVADTLPLDESLFDVVVFDEASQIPIEDALPTLYRAPQMIVVGDEMQLPPPSYFGRKLDSDDDDLPDYIAFGMQAESLLDKAAAALPATRLEWHYRSRHESLIGFCNQAFYAGHLRTIPSRQPLVTLPAIDTGASAPMRDQAQRVLNRPISFHQLTDATYVAQQNVREADYIADLVRALLSQDASKSIGIVAFSQAQQAAIEASLDRLAAAHPAFRNRLERALALDDEELFVKNLENVQGDERDIIIVSVAYGPGATGRMIMNFGPINQEGGEKRLNVIFSRAKHHVAVVASFDPSQIANDWNKGAKALKRYLMYAAAVSTGDTAAQTAAVAGYPGADRVAQAGQVADPLADVIAETYRAEGRTVARGLGQSTARCDIALRPAGAAAFTTAILTDNAGHYAIADMIDRYVTYPGLLRAAGWSVEFALAKDWLGRIPRKDESPIGGTATRRAVPGASTSGRRGDPSSHSPTLDAGPLDANLGSKDGA